MRIFSLNLNSFDATKNRFNTKIKRDDIELRKERAKKIAQYILDENHEIDIAIFQEVDCLKEIYDFYISIFEKAKYKCINVKQMGRNTKFCNLIIAKTKENINIDSVDNKFSDIFLNRWLEVEIYDSNSNKRFYLLNFHRKDTSDVYALLKYFRERKDENSIIMGDFNAARLNQREIEIKDSYIIYENTEFLNLFENSSYKEKGDEKYTFYNGNNKSDGRRIDHCFVSGRIAKYCECHTDESLCELTDHSAIVLDIKF